MLGLWWKILGYENIDGGGVCPAYLHRWRLFWSPWFKVYLHHFVGDDWSVDFHDHPKSFISLGLLGAYYEDSIGEGGGTVTRYYQAPWFRTFPATHTHRIRAKETGGAWTVVIVGRTVRDWGFLAPSGWVPWRKYVKEQGKERKSC